MPCKIYSRDAFIEVSVQGSTAAWEVEDAVRQLKDMDPRKERADLWVIAPESIIPLSAFAPLVDMVQEFCAQGIVGSRSAIVAASALQRAQLELYRAEAAALPFELQIFESRDEAVAWLNSPGKTS